MWLSMGVGGVGRDREGFDMWFHVIHHVVIVLIVAFFVLFAASKADGLVKLLGTIIGLVLLAVAVLHIVIAAWAMSGGKPFGMDMHGMHGGPGGWMHHGWMHHDGGPPPGAPATPATPAAPAAPAPAQPAAPPAHH